MTNGKTNYRKKEMLRDCVEIFNLENTSIIYDGIKRLWEQLSPVNEKKWSEIEDAISTIKDECSKSGKYLAQNVMSKFFQFLEYQPGEHLRNNEKEALAGMVLLYDKVLKMENNHDQMGIEKTYVEDYSKMCDFFSMIAIGMDCYLVHVRDSGNLILARSTEIYDEYTENFIFGLKKEDIEGVQRQNAEKELTEKDGEGIWYGDTVIFWPLKNIKEKSRLLIKLLLSRRRDIEYKQTVYIVFAGNKEITKNKCMEISRNILFLRQQIQILLERDLYALHHFKISYEDVKPLRNDGHYNILHISDLHVDAGNCQKIKDMISEEMFGVQDVVNDKMPEIDFIVVTGDVAQGKSTALDMEVNYRKAEEVLRCLAQKIWGDPENKKRIRYDWKKRIVMIPGNHDYASMNELLVINRNRAAFNGEPAREEGSPMIKYTYYIDFLRRLLDLDITDIIRQNLNEYRVYPKYHMEMVCFNTVAEVSMLRNNKVQIDNKFLESIPTTRMDIFFSLYLMHHTPLYVKMDMDYNSDKYGYKNIDEILYGILSRLAESYWPPDITEKEWDEIEKCLRSISSEGKKTDIYRDISYLYIHRYEETNERCNQIISEYKKNDRMCKKDRDIYLKRLNEYLNRSCPEAILGGHTHKIREDVYIANNKKIKCYETSKFYDKNTAEFLNYGILTIARNLEGEQKVDTQYTFYNSKGRYAIKNKGEDVVC